MAACKDSASAIDVPEDEVSTPTPIPTPTSTPTSTPTPTPTPSNTLDSPVKQIQIEGLEDEDEHTLSSEATVLEDNADFGQFTGKPAGARPDYRGRYCAVN
ncbi:UNVERIFIED_CONTAM: hypothetical protein FKN15_036988 [Acipenser sinensis]